MKHKMLQSEMYFISSILVASTTKVLLKKKKTASECSLLVKQKTKTINESSTCHYDQL